MRVASTQAMAALRNQPVVSCPKCGKTGPKGSMGTHRRFCIELGTFFWLKVDRRADDQCWLWMGRKDTSGYGRYGKQGQNTYPHRVAWRLTNGEIPAGLEVAHRCDVRACCNPSHLFLATHDENMADCKAKGRGTLGERSGKAILTEKQAREIIRDYKQTARNRSNIRELAARYPNVKPNTITACAKGRSWPHLHAKRQPQSQPFTKTWHTEDK